ncbi:serine/threonine-protein kinase pim-2-like isoform X2 [Stigmatopora nigra]
MSGKPVQAKVRRRMLNRKTEQRSGKTGGHGKCIPSRMTTRKSNLKPETQRLKNNKRACIKTHYRTKKPSERCLKMIKKRRAKCVRETETHTTRQRGKPTLRAAMARVAKSLRRNSDSTAEPPTKKLRFKCNGQPEKTAPLPGSPRKQETFTEKQIDRHPIAPMTRAKRKSYKELGPLESMASGPCVGLLSTTKPETFIKKTTSLNKDEQIQRTCSSKSRDMVPQNLSGISPKSSLTIRDTIIKYNSTLETLSKKPNEIPLETLFSTYQQAATNRELFEEKYQQVNKLGQGGFGSVYAGYRKSDCFPVAIKYIHKENIKGLRKDYPIEAVLMVQASIRKNSDGKSAVVSLLNKYDLEHQIVLVMERPVPSVDLFTYITRCRLCALPECEAKNIMKQLVVAAINMHAVDVFHRDLKQENILLEATSGGPRVRIIDFGCSCFASNEPYRDYDGTFRYAPPEYVLRRTYTAGPTTVWHLGALLFELMAGTKRFDTQMFLSQMLRLNRVFSEECEDLLWKCLNLDPEKRATLEQMQEHPWLT